MFPTRNDLLVVGTSTLWSAGDAGGRKLLAAAAQREGGLAGRNVVFTGRLGISREVAVSLARQAGASVSSVFTTRTDLPVVGTSTLWSAGDAGGRKLLAAAAHFTDFP